MDNRHVISINLGWSVNRDAHHSEFISDAFEALNTLFETDKLRAKDGAFHYGLLLTVLLYHTHVHEDRETRS